MEIESLRHVYCFMQMQPGRQIEILWLCHLLLKLDDLKATYGTTSLSDTDVPQMGQKVIESQLYVYMLCFVYGTFIGYIEALEWCFNFIQLPRKMFGLWLPCSVSTVCQSNLIPTNVNDRDGHARTTRLIWEDSSWLANNHDCCIGGWIIASINQWDPRNKENITLQHSCMLCCCSRALRQIEINLIVLILLFLNQSPSSSKFWQINSASRTTQQTWTHNYKFSVRCKER